MNAHAPLPFDPASEPTDDHAAWAEGVLRRQAAMLEALAEAGLRMALAVERRVTEAPADEPIEPAEAAMAFARVARAVRLTALLQSRLVQDIGKLRAETAVARAKAEAAARDAQARLDPAYRRKAQVEAVVERVAKADTDDEDEIDRLVAEAAERLDDEDLYGPVLDRPVGELVALICRDLGLDPDWTRLAEEAWAKAEAAGGDPRSPFVPLPLDGGEARSGGDLSAAPRLDGPPHPQPFPYQGGRGTEGIAPEPVLEPPDLPSPGPERPLSPYGTVPPPAEGHAGAWIGV